MQDAVGIEIQVRSRDAVAGANQIRRALRDVARESERTQGSVESFGQTLRRALAPPPVTLARLGLAGVLRDLPRVSGSFTQALGGMRRTVGGFSADLRSLAADMDRLEGAIVSTTAQSLLARESLARAAAREVPRGRMPTGRFAGLTRDDPQALLAAAGDSDAALVQRQQLFSFFLDGLNVAFGAALRAFVKSKHPAAAIGAAITGAGSLVTNPDVRKIQVRSDGATVQDYESATAEVVVAKFLQDIRDVGTELDNVAERARKDVSAATGEFRRELKKIELAAPIVGRVARKAADRRFGEGSFTGTVARGAGTVVEGFARMAGAKVDALRTAVDLMRQAVDQLGEINFNDAFVRAFQEFTKNQAEAALFKGDPFRAALLAALNRYILEQLDAISVRAGEHATARKRVAASAAGPFAGKVTVHLESVSSEALRQLADTLGRLPAEHSRSLASGSRASADAFLKDSDRLRSLQGRRTPLDTVNLEQAAICAADRYLARVDSAVTQLLGQRLALAPPAGGSRAGGAAGPSFVADTQRVRQLQDEATFQQQITTLEADSLRARRAAHISFGQEVRQLTHGLVRDLGDEFTQLALTGEGSFRALARSFAESVAQMVLQKQLLDPLFNSFGAILGLSSGGGGAGVSFASALSGAVAHGGGVLGADVFASRVIAPDPFTGAARFHRGGLVGGEVPVIARRGEGIFTPGQMEALGARQEGDTIIQVGDIIINMNQGASVPDVENATRLGRQLGQRLRGAVKSVLLEESRPGGLLFRR